MALSTIIANFKKYHKLVFLNLLVGLLGGVFFNYFYPVKFYAEGVLFVAKQAEHASSTSAIPGAQSAPSETSLPNVLYDFKYDGFYAQQSAAIYTDNLIGIVQSQELRYAVLEGLGRDTDTASLRKLKKDIQVKKRTPHIISISARDASPETAQDLWDEVTSKAKEFSNSLSEQYGEDIKVLQLPSAPVVKSSYRNPFIFGLAGVLLGMTTSLALVGLVSLRPFK